MVLRVRTEGLSASSQHRAKCLDKWKTDWFHEVSNLFTLTTDQVANCGLNQDDVALAASCGSVAANKYHARTLQNRAKMNMVVSMVERYVKGELSVEKNKKDCPTLNDVRLASHLIWCVLLNHHEFAENTFETRVNPDADDDLITPWTMVKPDEVCPMAAQFQKENCSDFMEDIGLETAVTDSSDDYSSPFDLESPLDDMSKLPENDLLAKACESLNKYVPKALETDNGSLARELSASKSSMPKLCTINNSKNNLTHSNSNYNNISTVESLKTNDLMVKLERCDAQSNQYLNIDKKRKRSVERPLTISNAEYVKNHIATIQSQKIKIVETIPATLPDGRVVQIQLRRTKPGPTPNRGVTHVLVPVNKQGNVSRAQLVATAVNRAVPNNSAANSSSFKINDLKQIKNNDNKSTKTTTYCPANSTVPTISLQNVSLSTMKAYSGGQTKTNLVNGQRLIAPNVISLPSSSTSYSIPKPIKTEVKIPHKFPLENSQTSNLVKTELNVANTSKANRDANNDREFTDDFDELQEIMAEIGCTAEDNDFYEDFMKNLDGEDISSLDVSPVSLSDQNFNENVTVSTQQTSNLQSKYRGKTVPQYGATERKALSPIDGNTKSQTSSKSNGTKKPKKRSADHDAQNPFQRPSLPYNIIIFLAFRHLAFTSLTVKQLYTVITDMFPYFKHAHSNWQNAIRHQLCCCKVYEKVPVSTLPRDELSLERVQSGKSAWRIRDETCIQKLRDDTVAAFGKPDCLKKIQMALADTYDFQETVGEYANLVEFKNIQSMPSSSVQKSRTPSPVLLSNDSAETTPVHDVTSPDVYEDVDVLSPNALERANMDFGKYIADFTTDVSSSGTNQKFSSSTEYSGQPVRATLSSVLH